MAARNIPTRVGKSPQSKRGTDRLSEHPHACGEIVVWSACLAHCLGTSPRVWGNRTALGFRSGFPRNIPTRVGKSFREGARVSGFAEHPHACGEIMLNMR